MSFLDEARIGRISDPRACWAPRPTRPEAPSQIVRQYSYVFGAASPADGCHDGLILPWADTECMSLFLGELAGRHPGEYILVFMDQAAWHRARALNVPPSMELAYLPPYRPGLNPQEQVWDELREKSMANRLFGSMGAVEGAALEGLRRIEASPGAVARLTRRGWMEPALGVGGS